MARSVIDVRGWEIRTLPGFSILDDCSLQNGKSDVYRMFHGFNVSRRDHGDRYVGLWRRNSSQYAPLGTGFAGLDKNCAGGCIRIEFIKSLQPHAALQNALTAERQSFNVWSNRGCFDGSHFSYEARGSTKCYCWSSQKGQGYGQEKNTGNLAAGNVPFVNWFRAAAPYIQGHRGSTFVIVIPGEVVENKSALESILQDIALLNGLGIKLVIVPGTHIQIDQLLHERGIEPQYVGAYRITNDQALQASMEAAGKIRVDIEAKLSRGPSIPILRRHGSSDRRHEVGVSICSGNFVTAKPRGVVNGIDFLSTGEVKKINVARIQERLDSNCIVILSNLGYSASGEVLNCNTYEVATACATALQADKLLCLLDGQVCDENGRLIRFMTLREADQLIRKRAGQSYTAADYVKAVAGPGYVKSLGLETKVGCASRDDSISNNFEATREVNGIMTGHEHLDSYISEALPSGDTDGNDAIRKGFAIGGQERLIRTYAYLSELTAAVYVCRGGVGRVHLLNGNIQGALLLELYTRDGVGNNGLKVHC
uniref:Aspartate/glutamate/uridylate kinase domain-containing protein n=1 Tax=Physcomitrium patens TaxID=3218 RepID=A0A7I4EYL7_PHYPA